MRKNTKIIINAIFCVAFICALWALNSCKSSEPIGAQGPEKIFNKAMEAFKDEDYLEAQKLFEVIKLQFPASQYADDAQFYMAEINYKQSQYILSAFNYSMLRRSYPGSDFYKKSLYQTAMCYYKLSPAFDRYQEYTIKAIQSFSEFQSVYPSDSLFKDVSDKISELREKLGHREFSTAELYKKLYTKKSALVYYDAVIDDYSDTKYYQPALYGKALTLFELKRYDEASNIVDYYLRQFPSGEKIGEFKLLQKDIEKVKGEK